MISKNRKGQLKRRGTLRQAVCDAVHDLYSRTRTINSFCEKYKINDLAYHREEWPYLGQLPGRGGVLSHGADQGGRFQEVIQCFPDFFPLKESGPVRGGQGTLPYQRSTLQCGRQRSQHQAVSVKILLFVRTRSIIFSSK